MAFVFLYLMRLIIGILLSREKKEQGKQYCTISVSSIIYEYNPSNQGISFNDLPGAGSGTECRTVPGPPNGQK